MNITKNKMKSTQPERTDKSEPKQLKPSRFDNWTGTEFAGITYGILTIIGFGWLLIDIFRG